MEQSLTLLCDGSYSGMARHIQENKNIRPLNGIIIGPSLALERGLKESVTFLRGYFPDIPITYDHHSLGPSISMAEKMCSFIAQSGVDKVVFRVCGAAINSINSIARRLKDRGIVPILSISPYESIHNKCEHLKICQDIIGVSSCAGIRNFIVPAHKVSFSISLINSILYYRKTSDRPMVLIGNINTPMQAIGFCKEAINMGGVDLTPIIDLDYSNTIDFQVYVREIYATFVAHKIQTI